MKFDDGLGAVSRAPLLAQNRPQPGAIRPARPASGAAARNDGDRFSGRGGNAIILLMNCPIYCFARAKAGGRAWNP